MCVCVCVCVCVSVFVSWCVYLCVATGDFKGSGASEIQA